MKQVFKIIVLLELLAGAFIQDLGADEMQPMAKPEVSFCKTSSEYRNAGFEYKARFKNFPVDTDFRLTVCRSCSLKVNHYMVLTTLRNNSNGTFTADGICKPILIQKVGPVPGERLNYKLLAADDSVVATYSFIPSPIITKSKKRRFTVEAELISMAPTIYAISFKGLEPHELVKLQSENNGKLSELYYDPDMHDRIFHFMPGEVKKKSGQVKLTITTNDKDSACLSLTCGIALCNEYTARLEAMNEADRYYNGK